MVLWIFLPLIIPLITAQQYIPNGQQYAPTGGQRAVRFMRRSQVDLTRDYMDELIERMFDRVKCRTRTSDDCKNCLSGARLFALLNQTSITLSYSVFEHASKLILCYARNIETLCQEHDDDDDYWRCDDDMTSYLSDVTNPGALSSQKVGDLLSEFRDNYEDRVEDILENQEEMDNDEEDQDDDNENDDDENDDELDDLDDILDASLFSTNCVSTDKLLDELDLDDDDLPEMSSLGGLSALLLVHLVNGDEISDSCRTLPSRSSFLDELYDDTDDGEKMSYIEFRALLDDLNIGNAQTVAIAARTQNAPNVFTPSFAQSRPNTALVSSYGTRGKRGVSMSKFGILRKKSSRADSPEMRQKRSIQQNESGASKTTQKVTAKKMDPNRCFSRDEILALAKADQYGGVPKNRFKDICPVLIQQQRELVCEGVSDQTSPQTQRYIYTTVAGLILCACCLLGALMMVCLGKTIYQTALVLLLGLAMGTLTAHAFMQLLPQAFGLQASIEGQAYRRRTKVAPSWIAIVSVIGAYVLYVIECLIEKSRRKPHLDDPTKNSDNGRFGNNESFSKMTGNIKDIYSKSVSVTVILVAVTDVFHKLGSGLAIGVAFSLSTTLGLGTSLSVILQNVAHELGQTAVLLNAGLNILQTLLVRACVSLFGVVGAYIGASTGTLVVQQWIFAATAGLFLYIAFSKIAPSVVSAIKETNFGYKFLVHNVGIICGLTLVIGLCVLDAAYYP